MPAPLTTFPALEWSDQLHEKFNTALLALGRLDSVSVLLPDTSLFLYMYVRKEDVLSSMIESTQSSLSDLLLHELKHQPGVSLDDVMEELAFPAKWNPEGFAMEDGRFVGAQQGTGTLFIYAPISPDCIQYRVTG